MSEVPKGPEPTGSELPLPDWLEEEGQAIPHQDVVTTPVPVTDAIVDTQPLALNPTEPQGEAETSKFEVLQRGVSRAEIAFYGLGAYIAERRAKRAGDIEKKVEHRQELYGQLGTKALAKIVEKAPGPEKVSELGQGVRGRGMNRDNLFSDPGPFMELRYSKEESLRRKQKRAGPATKGFKENRHAHKLDRRVAKFERAQKNYRRVRNTSQGKYKPWGTRLRRLTDRSTPPVIRGTSELRESRLQTTLKRKRVQRLSNQPIISKIRRSRLEHATETKNLNYDRAQDLRARQADIRRSLEKRSAPKTNPSN